MTQETQLITRRSMLSLGAAILATNALAPYPAMATTSSTVSGDQFLRYDALGLAELIRQGLITPGQLVEIAARRIAALDGDLNAMTTLTPA